MDWMKNMKLKGKMIIAAAILGIVPVAVVGLLVGNESIKSAHEEISTQEQEKLEGILQAKQTMVERYLHQIQNQVITLSDSHMAANAMADFSQAFHSFTKDGKYSSKDIARMRNELRTYYQAFGAEYTRLNQAAAPTGQALAMLDDAGVALQYALIQKNPNPLGSKDAMTAQTVGGKTSYAKAHAKYHDEFRSYLQKFEYYDIFLLDANTGHVVYSVFKEMDYATSMKTGAFANSGLAEVFRKANAMHNPEDWAISDFAAYKPSYDNFAGFIASPIFDKQGKHIGVLAMQMPISQINDVMTSKGKWKEAGLGASGETYLVGEDKTLRSESRFLIEDKAGYLAALKAANVSNEVLKSIEMKNTGIGLQAVNSLSAQQALAGEHGFHIVPDYRNVPVLSAFSSIEFEGLNWVIIAEIDEEEAFASTVVMKNKINNEVLLIVLIVGVIAIVVAIFGAGSVATPVSNAARIAENITKGDFNNDASSSRGDEIGDMMGALAGMQTTLQANKERNADFEGQLDAIGRVMATIEFDLEGNIQTANDHFLNALGYTLDEVKGKHHSIFVTAEYKASAAYKQFWQQLNAGEAVADKFMRLAKDGSEVWIQASYNPIRDPEGNIYKVVKFATDITEDAVRNADYTGQLQAIGNVMGTIEFDLDGTIETANENFLQLMGYTLAEVKGKHQSLFVTPEYEASPEYKQFWQQLNAGEAVADQFMHLAKDGSEVWIQASYNPIRDANGKVYKVVNFATDITEEAVRNADFTGQLQAIGEVMGSIEFGLDGTVQTANENFLQMMGYSLDEVKGKHHSLFVAAEDSSSSAEMQFWQSLGNGDAQTNQYRRMGKGGKEVWVQASYNPIRDANGSVYKVVKFATDITAQKEASRELEAMMNEAKNVLQSVAKQDLRLEVVGEYGGELGELKTAVNDTVDSLRNIVGDILTTAGDISSGAGEINEGNTNLSERTQQQASALEETAASIEEMTGTVQQNADNARQADQLAASARDQAESGGAIVGKVVTAMAGITS
ncbi:MAG: PAS domain S-box protein, partial [Ghiorsea sp.]